MSDKPVIWIALLRAIGPATHKKMSMAQLKAACERSGFRDVTTVLATGNVIFRTEMKKQQILSEFKGIIKAHDLDLDVFLRQPEDLEKIIAENPFLKAAEERPNHLLIVFNAEKTPSRQASELNAWPGPESVSVKADRVYIDYVEGVARSKLTPNFIERRLGQSGTARNWNTIRKLLDKSALL